MSHDAAAKLPTPTCVLVATGDDLLEAYLRHLAGQGSAFSVRRVRDGAGLAALDGTAATDVVVLDERLVEAEPGRLRPLLAGRRVVVVSDRDLEATVQLLAGNEALNHVLIREGGSLPRQLAVTLDAVLGQPTPGIGRYLAAGSPVTTTRLAATAEKQRVLEAIGRAAGATAGFSELPGVVATIASELLMNAIFNAPHAGDQPLYREKPRHEPLALKAGEDVTVAFGHDDQVFALSVRDNFGMLTRETIMANFARAATSGDAQIRMKTAGAGVGLYMVLSLATQLDVHVRRGKSTEIVALVGLSKRYRDFARSGHSFNLYISDEGHEA